jgi:hypothetical protein
VLFGALLLAQCLAGALWSQRLFSTAADSAGSRSGLEGAR